MRDEGEDEGVKDAIVAEVGRLIRVLLTSDVSVTAGDEHYGIHPSEDLGSESKDILGLRVATKVLTKAFKNVNTEEIIAR